MPISIVFETHSWSEDNERGVATGWLPGRLSQRGRQLARELGVRHRHDELAAVFTSDLRRAVETVEIAFAGTALPLLHDWRLRECDYGDLNGAPAGCVHADRQRRATTPYPGGESWAQAIRRVGGFLRDLPSRWQGALPVPEPTRIALDHVLGGRGMSATARLGLPPDASPAHTRAVVLHAIRYWRDQLDDPLLDQPTVQSYHAAVRSCEAIIAR